MAAESKYKLIPIIAAIRRLYSQSSVLKALVLRRIQTSRDRGVLFDDIVECPLHGAAFCVRTGEVEAFPAVVDGEIQVNPNPQ